MRLPVLWAFLALGLAAAAAEVILLPNLVTVPLYLALTTVTTVAVAASVGITRSGLRRALSRHLRAAASLAVASLSTATVYVLLLQPYLSAPPPRHDGGVTFAPATSSVVAPAEAPAAPPTSPPAPTVVLAGTFNHGPGPDTVSGSATLGRTVEGANVLRLSGLDSTPGPDLYLYLARSESPNGPQATSGLLVSQLKTYRGDFTFTLDPGLDLSQFRSAVVFCRSFNVVFGYANLK